MLITVLFFFANSIETSEEREAFASLKAAAVELWEKEGVKIKVHARNAEFAIYEENLELADYVAGEVPENYQSLPNFSDFSAIPQIGDFDEPPAPQPPKGGQQTKKGAQQNNEAAWPQ